MVHSIFFKVPEIQVSYNPKFRAVERPEIITAKDAYQIFIQEWDLGKIAYQEELKILLLNTKSRVLGIVHIASGSTNGIIADPRIIFSAALKACAAGVILCHCHPSGELVPSAQDRCMTDKLKAGGRILDIKIIDHLIISRDEYYSFSDQGIL